MAISTLLLLMMTSFFWYPTYDTTRVKGNFCAVIKENSPLASVDAPLVIPLMYTEAPIMNSFVLASITLPVILALMVGLSWAEARSGNTIAVSKMNNLEICFMGC